MAITADDILNKEFSKKLRGYDEEEVNDFLDLVVVDYDKALEEAAELRRQLADAKEKIKYFESLQESLNSSILIANEAAERLKQNARKEAELILYEAERESDRIVGSAHETINNLTNEVEVMRHNGHALQSELRRMLTQQLDALNMTNFDSLADHAANVAQQAQANYTSPATAPVAQTVVEPVAEPVVETVTVEAVEVTETPEVEPTPAFVADPTPTVESILGQTIKIELPDAL